MAQLNNLPLFKDEDTRNLKFQTKEEFDKCYNKGFYVKEKDRHQKSIPWEVKNFEYCELNSIPSILDSTQKHFTKSSKDENTERNELADIFEEIMDFSDDEDNPPPPTPEKESDNSSIISSEDEESFRSPYKIIEVELSIS
mmetsp:Transcript_24768/g.21992  ORF Transcript_24768/g.21992 Transcript_24768/m.21992 type:complete len:141 (+) Transcript_24768:810-1232(+)